MNINDINNEISLLEPAEINARNVQVLASLYTIRNNMGQAPDISKMPVVKGTEFNDAISGVSINDMLNLLNEHMDVIRALMPNEYKKIIEQLNNMWFEPMGIAPVGFLYKILNIYV